MSEEILREETETQAAQAVDEQTAQEVDPVEEFRQKMSSLHGQWYYEIGRASCRERV